MKMKRLFVCFAAMALFAGCSQKQMQPVAAPTWYANETYFQEKNSLYVDLPLDKSRIVMFGDDIADRGEWLMFYGDTVMRNRGIALEGTEHSLYRIDNIASYKPAKIFVSTGMRDVLRTDSPIPAEVSAENIKELFARAATISPETELYFMSIIPNGLMNAEQVAKAAKINELVKAGAKGYKYSDVTSPLVGSNGILGEPYCWDKFNLNGAGYEVLAKTLEPYVGKTALNKAADREYPEQFAHYKNRVSIFNSLPKTAMPVVMLGNSLTNNGPWYELLPFNCLNRGISGDHVEGIYNRLDDVIEQQPATINLLSGLNDFIDNSDRTPAQVWKSYEKLIEKITKELPNTQLVVFSTLPVNPITKFYDGINEKVAELNKYLSSGTQQHKYIFINLAEKLMDENGDLDAKYTFDGIHLSADGYFVWAAMILSDPTLPYYLNFMDRMNQ